MNRKQLFSVFISLAMSVLVVFGCKGGTGSTIPTVADLSIEVWDDGDSPYPAGGECVRTISWTFTPVSLTGSSGRSTAFNMQDRQYKSNVQTGDCFYSQSVQDLRAGEWTIEAVGVDDPYASWKTSCSVNLNSEESSVYFVMGMPGCSTTAAHLTP
jgi:hypothetical protein